MPITTPVQFGAGSVEIATGTNASSREDALGEAQDAVHNLTLGPY